MGSETKGISGSIDPVKKTSGNIQPDGTISGKVSDGQAKISGAIGVHTETTGELNSELALSGSISNGAVIYKDVPLYEGEYTVTPKTKAQTLETTGKKMVDDVIIKSIPYFETSNQYGYTVYIGSEV